MTDAGDDARLARLGYAQQLLRDLGGFGSFAVSFSVISILTGAVTLYGYGMRYGGPYGVVVGWLVVSLGTLPVAASMAQLASSFPTAGALYHWSSILGGRGWGWLTAWLNLVGQFAITAGIDWGLAEFVVPGAPLATRGALFVALLASHAALNVAGIRAVNLLSKVSAWYHLVGTVAIVVALASLMHPQPLAFLLQRSIDARAAASFHGAGFGAYGYAFAVALLMGGFTFTGYDASAHVSEETHDAARAAPRGIVLAVVVSAVAGGALLVAATLGVRDVRAVADPDSVGFAVALAQALPPPVARALTWLAMGAMWFCGLASVTSNSRMLFAFARDGGVPASTTLARVSPRWRTPANAVVASALGACAIALLCIGWGLASRAPVADVLGRITAASTVGLYLSYLVPIAAGLAARRRGRWRERGPWDLGRLSDATNLVAVAWLAGLSVVVCLPPNGFVAWMFAAALGALAVAWVARARTRFAGPPILSQTDAAPATIDA